MVTDVLTVGDLRPLLDEQRRRYRVRERPLQRTGAEDESTQVVERLLFDRECDALIARRILPVPTDRPAPSLIGLIADHDGHVLLRAFTDLERPGEGYRQLGIFLKPSVCLYNERACETGAIPLVPLLDSERIRTFQTLQLETERIGQANWKLLVGARAHLVRALASLEIAHPPPLGWLSPRMLAECQARGWVHDDVYGIYGWAGLRLRAKSFPTLARLTA